MSEENEVEVEQPEIEEIEESSQQEDKKGFLTYDEYVDKGGDPDAFQGPKAYDAYGKMIKEIKGLRSDIRQKDTTLATLADLYRREEERISDKYRNYYGQQQQRLAQAEEMGDSPTMRDSARALANTEVQHNQEQAQLKTQYQNQLVQQFIEKNADWYNDSNPALQNKAKTLAIDYEKMYPHLATQDPVYLLNKVEEEIRGKYLVGQQYAHHQQDDNRGANYTIPPSQAAMNRSGGSVKTKVNSLPNDLKDEYKQVHEFYKNMNIDYSVDDFINFHERNKV